MVSFFQSVVSFFEMIGSFLMNIVNSLLTLIQMLLSITQLNVFLLGYMPSFLGTCFLVVSCICVVKLIVGRS